MKTNTTPSKVLELSDVAAMRKYPFTRETLDQIMALRQHQEDRIYESTGEVVTVPAPVIISEAVNIYYTQTLKGE